MFIFPYIWFWFRIPVAGLGCPEPACKDLGENLGKKMDKQLD